MNIGEVIEHLKGYEPETACAYDLWLPEDVEQQAEQMEPQVKLTDEEIDDVLEITQSSKDANYGICWTTIDCGIEEIVSRRGIQREAA